MDEILKQTLCKNFCAAIDMLGDSIQMCPLYLWQNEKRFFYLSYHTLIFLDYYLSKPVKSFQPALPFSLADPDSLPPEAVDDVLAHRRYSQSEMLDWLSEIRQKCKNAILNATPYEIASRWIEEQELDLHGLCPSLVAQYTLLEIWFYNLRHLQHHVGQLNLILRQRADEAPDWISFAE